MKIPLREGMKRPIQDALLGHASTAQELGGAPRPPVATRPSSDGTDAVGRVRNGARSQKSEAYLQVLAAARRHHRSRSLLEVETIQASRN